MESVEYVQSYTQASAGNEGPLYANSAVSEFIGQYPVDQIRKLLFNTVDAITNHIGKNNENIANRCKSIGCLLTSKR